MTATVPSRLSPEIPDLRSQLAAHFAPDDIEWRIGQAGKKDDGSIWAKAFAYITNRAIQDRLDAVAGPANWRNEYRPWEIGTPGVLCGLSLKVDGEWVTKWDGAEQTDMEPLKGGLSGAMKRAAVQWGVGRYLYDLPEGWANVHPKGAHFANNVKVKVGGQEQRITFKWDPPTLPKWALPEVKSQRTAPAQLNGEPTEPELAGTGEMVEEQVRDEVIADARERQALADIETMLPGLTVDQQIYVKEKLADGADPVKLLERMKERALVAPAGR